jgi:ATP-dependent DNA helicase RecG
LESWLHAEEDEHLELKEARNRFDFAEQGRNLHLDDLLLLDSVHRQLPLGPHLRQRVEPLLELGAIERVGRGRGVRYLLSRRFYQAVGKQGAYTRKRGLDRETNKALLLKHIERRRTEGCQLRELQEVLPSLSKGQVQTLLREMKQAGVVHSVGHTRAGHWFPGPAQKP